MPGRGEQLLGAAAAGVGHQQDARRPCARRGRCGRCGAAALGVVDGRSAWMTRPRSGRSRPRAATSVATQTRARPSRRACSASVRSFWLSSPESATAEKPRSRRLPCRWRTASRVAQNTSAPGRLEVAQHVDDGVLDLAAARRAWRGSRCRRAARRGAAVSMRSGVALVALGQGWRSSCGDGGREQQGAALGRRGVEDVLQVLAEAEVEHLVGLVEHHGPQRPRGRGCRARGGRAGGPGVPTTMWQPAASAALLARAGPCRRRRRRRARRPRRRARPARADLHGQLAGRRDDQGQRRAGAAEAARPSPSRVGGHGQAEGHGLARAGLGRDQQVAAGGRRLRARRPARASARDSRARRGRARAGPAWVREGHRSGGLGAVEAGTGSMDVVRRERAPALHPVDLADAHGCGTACF